MDYGTLNWMVTSLCEKHTARLLVDMLEAMGHFEGGRFALGDLVNRLVALKNASDAPIEIDDWDTLIVDLDTGAAIQEEKGHMNNAIALSDLRALRERVVHSLRAVLEAGSGGQGYP